MDTIIIKIGKKYSFIKINEIKWIESDSGYIKIHSDNKSYIVRMTLQDFESKLVSNNLIRISRSKMINMIKIKEVIDSEKSNDFTVVLNDNTALKWGRRYRGNFPALPIIK